MFAERQFVVKTRLLTLAIILVALFQLEAGAQTRPRKTPPPAPTLMSSLPQSDAVAQVKMKQLLSEATPRLLAGSPAKLMRPLNEKEIAYFAYSAQHYAELAASYRR